MSQITVAALSIAIFSSILAVRTRIHLTELNCSNANNTIKQTTFLYATNDTFLIALIILIFTIPLSLMMRKRKKQITLQPLKQKTNP
ncbi:hypothetical protein ACWV26_08590 [Rummeliibacillus sp. JY-2-4R]